MQGGLDDEQLALWIKHNDTLTIRGRKFADAEFKPTLNSLSSGTPDQRADELMKFVVENPEQLVKDQDVPYKYKYGTATKTARMNDQDKEIVTERVERVIDVYQSWKKSEEKQ